MTADGLIAMLLAIAMLVYLLYTLVEPRKF
jgi:hypothetical protein